MAARMNTGFSTVARLAVSSLILAFAPGISFADSEGITNATNKPGASGAGCASCHNPQGGPVAFVTITGPATLDAGATGDYTVTGVLVTPTAGVKMGLNVAASDGFLSNAPLQSTRIFNNEIIHTTSGSPPPPLHTTNSSGHGTYKFRYTMPGDAASGSTHKLYAVAALGGPGSGGWAHAPEFTVTTGAALANPPRLSNIATRAQVLTGDDVLIGGFIIGGSTPKKVLVRARGPSLTALGVAGAMANPQLNLYSGQTVIASNGNWVDASNVTEIQQTGFAPTDNLEAAILVTLNPGPYTAIVTGESNGTGVAIVEVFEVDAFTTPLVNIAARARVGTGDNVVIGGFIVQGNGPQTVVVRARGPSLASAGVAGVLANPQLQLYSGQTVIASNDNWQQAPNAAQIIQSGQAPSDANESAIMMSLQPGGYTAIVSGVNSGQGVGIVEVFTTNVAP